MDLKVIISFFVLLISVQNSALCAGSDSIRKVSISDKLIWDEATQTYTLLPIDHAFFDTDVNKIMFTIELQNMSSEVNSKFIFVEIKKKSIKQFQLRPIVSKKINLQASRNLYIDSIDLPETSFNSGNFDLIVNYMNDSFKVLDVKKISFQLLRTATTVIPDEYYVADVSKGMGDESVENTFVKKYDLNQIRKNMLSLSPLAKGAEVKVIKEIASSEDVNSMKQFFYNFWKNRKPTDPEKAWNEYAVILNDIGKRYGNASTPGYETDRGRIYIQYGAPDRVERILSEKGALPYEVWFYYTSGDKSNVKFLFYQPGMLSNQVYLLNSNVPEEVINPYWKDQLLENPNDGNNKLTHKVFEFFK